MPPDLNALLNSHADLNGTEILKGTPEHKIPLDNFRGETRNADLVLVGNRGEARISVNIEAKADEPYDQTITEKLNSVKSPGSKIPDRIDLLCQALFGQTPDSNPELLDLRYQLLTGCAGALVEASRIGANAAVFVVHVFISWAVDPQKVRRNDDDFRRFLGCLGKNYADHVADGSMTGPIKVPGGTFVPCGIPLFVGKIKTKVALSEA